jgi:hypothetical protein
MGRRRGSVLELEDNVVEVAVVPVLARFEGADQGVAVAAEMGGGVSAGRVVATSDVGTGLTDPQVNPVVTASGQAVLATCGGRRTVDYLVEVGAGRRHL